MSIRLTLLLATAAVLVVVGAVGAKMNQDTLTTNLLFLAVFLFGIKTFLLADHLHPHKPPRNQNTKLDEQTDSHMSGSKDATKP